MKEEKPIYRTQVVIDPDSRSALVSSGKIKPLAIGVSSITLNRQVIPYSQMVSRRLQDGCIQFWQGQEMVRFAVQGFGSKGAPDPSLTYLVNNLIDAVQSGNSEEADTLVLQLKNIKRRVGLVFAIITLAVIIVGSSFGVFWEFFVDHPKALLIYPLVIIGIPFVLGRLGGWRYKNRQ